MGPHQGFGRSDVQNPRSQAGAQAVGTSCQVRGPLARRARSEAPRRCRLICGPIVALAPAGVVLPEAILYL